MNQQPDKFFREKLQGYQKQAPADAWQRISGNVRKKNHAGLWLRIAAAVALLVTGTLLIYPLLQSNEQQRVAENETSREREPLASVSETEKKDSLSGSDTHAQDRGTAKDPILHSEKQTPISRKAPKKKAVVPSPEQSAELPVAVNEPVHDTIPSALEKSSHFAATEGSVVSEEADAQSKNVTIIFSAEEVNRKYLVKNTNTEATHNEKESSGLRKLLDKAYDLKHNQDPLGDLRQKKDEILAMNFRNDKRTQND